MSLTKKRILFLWSTGCAVATLSALFAAAPVSAQNPPDTAAAATIDTLATQPQPSPVASGLLDAPIVRSEYHLGPGDVIAVTILGDYNQVHSVTVSPEGTALLPRIGVVPVLGLNLNEAEARVRAAVGRLYRNVGVQVNLARVRRFKVYVLGHVNDPGVREATAATRVSEILMGEYDPERRIRNFVVRRSSGEELQVDLVRFAQTGDLDANPVLLEGDVVIVPIVDEIVQVLGRVRFPGDYEYLEGETLSDLLHVANGGAGFPANAADSVRVVRVLPSGNRTMQILTRADALGDAGRGFVMQPADAVMVAEIGNFRRQYSVAVWGEVRRPGFYPIRPDTTTVRELVEMAGGFTPEASLTEAVLRRSTSAVSQRALDQLTRVPPELLSPSEQQILAIRMQGDVATQVSVDFRYLFAAGQPAYDQTLQPNDELTVPARRNEITILGAVTQPGIVGFSPGLRPREAVELAGGLSRRADFGDAVVLRARSGTRVDVGDVRSLDPGDSVIVPYKEPRDWLRILQTTSATVTTAIGLWFTLRSLSDL